MKNTILIIDDERAVLESLAAYLDDCGYRTLTAGDGARGLEILDRERVDLVIVDLRMPEMDGLDVLARVGAVSPETPSVVVSGTGMIQDAVDALHCGAWDYVLKPIEDFSVLTHAVDNCLEKARLQRENREYQQRLERMVAERTAELESANAHLSQINDRLRRIVETTRSLAFCSDLDQFGSLLLKEFGRHMPAAGGSLYISEENGLRLLHSLDPGHAMEFIPFPLVEGSVFQQVFVRGEPILIRDVSQHEGLTRSGWNGYKDGSALAFPLPDEVGGIAGVIALHGKKTPPFVEQDLEIGSILASYSCEALRAVRAVEDLRDNEQRFRGILDSIQTGIVLVDPASFEVLYANPTAARMYGAPAEAMVGRVCHEMLCPGERGRCPIVHLGQVFDLAERSLRTVDGRDTPILKTVSRTVLQGKGVLLESFDDLSAQKLAESEKAQLERQLRQSQKMEALGTLAGGIAHDFNNILCAVLGYTELGLLELDDESHPLHVRLSAINRAGQRARDLVRQILAFSRMQEKVFAPLTIGPIIKEVVKLLRSSLPAGIAIRSDIGTDLKVMGDATEIHQVVMNLCTNAYHSMREDGGSLSISLEAVDAERADLVADVDLQPGKYVKMTVSDTGCGIGSDVLDRIFEPYFTTKSKSEGTGLGLAVAHGIIKNHLGAISVQSRVGEGSQFSVFLPVAGEKEDEDAASHLPLPRGSERILFVDDEEAVVDIGRQILQRLGYRVTAVVGGLAALESFRRSPGDFDLVITDLSMPGLSGVQLAKELTGIRPGIPIILCTGFSGWYQKEQGEFHGIRQVLMKPLNMESLARTIRKTLEDRCSIDK